VWRRAGQNAANAGAPRWVAAVRQSNVEILVGTRIVDGAGSSSLLAIHEDQPIILSYRGLILATGRGSAFCRFQVGRFRESLAPEACRRW